MQPLRSIPGGVLIATVIGVVDSMVVWGIATLFNIDILVPDGPGSETLTEITFGPMVFVVAVAAVAAGVFLWLLQGLVPDRALRLFQIVAVVVLLVSLLAPFQTEQSLAGQLALVTMHVLAGSAIIGTMTWVATKRTVTAADLG